MIGEDVEMAPYHILHYVAKVVMFLGRLGSLQLQYFSAPLLEVLMLLFINLEAVGEKVVVSSWWSFWFLGRMELQ